MKHTLSILLMAAVCASANAHEEPRREELIRNALQPETGDQISIHEGSYPPGWDSGWHHHPGDLYIYVLQGKLRVDFRDRDSVIAEQGQVALEPAGISNRAVNLDNENSLKLLLIHLAPGDSVLSISEE